MNERIRELAEQAGYKPLGTFADELMEIYNKKFAELIVRECAELCREEGKKLEEQSIHSNSYQSYFLASLIKHHFGVE